MSKKYQKLDLEEKPVVTQTTSAAETSSNETFSVTILLKEAHLCLPNLTDQTTVGQLKAEVEKLTNVAVQSQRLIYCGKPLKLDDKTIKSCNITPKSSIHLFPIPVIKPTDAVAVDICGENSTAPGAVLSSVMTGGRQSEVQSIHSDPVISHHCRYVQLWSVLLVFFSTTTLFNTLSYVLSRGQFGINALDTTVAIVNAVCSAAGLLVGNYGLNAARTVDMISIKKYFRYLTMLAVLCIVMRIIWIFDVLNEINKELRDSKNADPTTDPNTDPTTITAPTAADRKNVAIMYYIQIAIVAVLTVGAWLNCVYRAHQFRQSVQTYTDASMV